MRVARESRSPVGHVHVIERGCVVVDQGVVALDEPRLGGRRRPPAAGARDVGSRLTSERTHRRSGRPAPSATPTREIQAPLKTHPHSLARADLVPANASTLATSRCLRTPSQEVTKRGLRCRDSRGSDPPCRTSNATARGSNSPHGGALKNARPTTNELRSSRYLPMVRSPPGRAPIGAGRNTQFLFARRGPS